MTHKKYASLHSTRTVLSFALIIAFISCFIIYAKPRSVDALASGGIGGYPAQYDSAIQYSDSWFIYNLDAGESKQDGILLTNTSDAPQTIKLYAVDSVATNDGNFSLKAEDDPKTGVGAWIDLSRSEVTLNPGEELTIPFTITMPDSVDVGEHSGGIIIQKVAAPEAGQGQIGASIVTRVGIRVYETVPGEIVKKLELAGFTVDKVETKDKEPLYQISITAKNLSTVSLKANVSLAVTGWGKIKYFPNSRFKEGLNLDFSDFTNFFKGQTFSNDWQILRDQTVSTGWEWPQPAFGRFTFTASVSYQSKEGLETLIAQPITITIIPWPIIISLCVIILLIILLILASKIRFSSRKWKEYKVRQGDQLADLAAKAGISWKKLAKANKLKVPILNEGQTILVPPSLAAVQPKTQVLPAAKKTDKPVRDISGIVNMPVRPGSAMKEAVPAPSKKPVRKSIPQKPRTSSVKRTTTLEQK